MTNIWFAAKKLQEQKTASVEVKTERWETAEEKKKSKKNVWKNR